MLFDNGKMSKALVAAVIANIAGIVTMGTLIASGGTGRRPTAMHFVTSPDTRKKALSEKEKQQQQQPEPKSFHAPISRDDAPFHYSSRPPTGKASLTNYSVGVSQKVAQAKEPRFKPLFDAILNISAEAWDQTKAAGIFMIATVNVDPEDFFQEDKDVFIDFVLQEMPADSPLTSIMEEVDDTDVIKKKAFGTLLNLSQFLEVAEKIFSSMKSLRSALFNEKQNQIIDSLYNSYDKNFSHHVSHEANPPLLLSLKKMQNSGGIQEALNKIISEKKLSETVFLRLDDNDEFDTANDPQVKVILFVLLKNVRICIKYIEDRKSKTDGSPTEEEDTVAAQEVVFPLRLFLLDEFQKRIAKAFKERAGNVHEKMATIREIENIKLKGISVADVDRLENSWTSLLEKR